MSKRTRTFCAAANSWWVLACVGLLLPVVGCGLSDDMRDRVLGVWSYADTNVYPPALLALKLSTNGQGALFGGQKIAFPISFAYAVRGAEVRMTARSVSAGLGSLCYQPSSDTMVYFDGSGNQATLARDRSFVTAALLESIIGATNLGQITQRMLPGGLTNPQQYFRKKETQQ
jgi:hypothetical protein